MLGKINSWNIGKVKATKIVEIDRTGDFLHYSCKMEKLDWITSMDWNPELAKDTRKEKLLKYANKKFFFWYSFCDTFGWFCKKKNDHFIFEVQHPLEKR